MVGAGADPVQSTTPLDLLRGRNLICDETYSAASWFHGVAGLTLGRPYDHGSLDFTRGTEPPEIALRKGEIQYAFIAETIDAFTRGRLLELIHFQLCPHWLIGLINNGCAPSPQRRAEQAECMKALAQLTRVHRDWCRHGPGWR
jgi:hypothetical protein